MDIEQVKVAKKKLEREIERLVVEFEHLTGAWAEGVHLEVTTARVVGGEPIRCLSVSVHVRL